MPDTPNPHWKRQFILIYIGQAFSLVGSAAVQFSIIWWLTRLTESPITLTVATIAGFLPTLVLGPFAGVLVDRINRRTVMMLADGFVALSSIALAVVFLINPAPSVWVLYLILFLRGLGGTFHGPALSAAIPSLVPLDILTKTGSWGQMIQSVSTMIGPALGALLMATASMPAIMLVDIVGAAFAILCLFFVKIPDIPKSAQAPHLLTDLKLGFRTMRANRALMAIFIPVMLINILYSPLGSLFPLLVRVHFGGTEFHIGLSEVVFSAGMLIGSLVLGVWGGMKKRFLMMSLAILLLGIGSTIGGLLPPSGFYVFVAGCFFISFSTIFFNVPIVSYVQQTVPNEMLGKVLSLITTTATLAMPFGLLVAGPLAEKIGISRWFAYSGLGIILVAVYLLFRTRAFDVPAGPPPETADLPAGDETGL